MPRPKPVPVPPRCMHCGYGKVSRPRGLCWTCYRDPAIRTNHPPLGEFGIYGSKDPEAMKSLKLRDAWLFVMQDMKDRRAKGLKEYGVPVSPDRPDENWLRHAYEETLDKAVYLKAELMRRKS
jgi:hypothetical protein